MSKELVVDQAVDTLRRGLPFVQNGMQYTLDTVDSLLECDAEETDKVKALKETCCHSAAFSVTWNKWKLLLNT